MIIEAKANRRQAEPEDPRKRLEFNTPEKTSRLPVYFALLITGIAAYLKSAFPAQSQGAPHTSDDGVPSAGGNTPRSGRMEPGRPDIDETTTGSIGDDEPGNTIAYPRDGWDHGFVMLDPVSFNYSAASFDYLGPQVAVFFPAAFNYQPQNDNRDRPTVPGSGTIPRRPDIAAPNHPSPGGNEPTPDDEDDDDEDEDDDVPTPGNRAPMHSGPVRLNDVFAGQVMLIGLSQLLFGATDPDGDILTINDITVTGGTLVQLASGWSFVTSPGMLGVFTFTYDISDGLLEVVQTAVLEVVRNTVLLTPCDDVFVGTPYDDDIDGLAGNDIIDARAGNDVVDGGSGDDHIQGGDGDDQLFGGRGNDVIFGGRGNDVIGGGRGSDRLFGDEGDDVIDGDEGDDFLMGGLGDDILDGGDGDDEIEGNEGADVIIAGAGDDIASGEDGNDVIEGNDGDDELSGGAGDDVIDGGAGDDVVEGSDGNDTLTAGCGDDVVAGGQGDDILRGDEGDDTLSGDGGSDLLDGGDGSDTLLGGADDDTLLGGDGDDEIYGGTGDDMIVAGNGDDEIDAGAGDDTIVGGAGYDRINGGDGHDTLDYSAFTADIHLEFETGIAWSDQIDEDLFENVEEVIGGQGDDTFVFGATTAIISGGRGDDLFIFTVSEETPTLSRQLVFEILDFVVGDRIHVAEYELSHRAERLEEERFGDIYDALEEGFEAGLPIRVSHAFYDDMDHTIIEADVDRNDFYEISITLDGVQLPLMVGHHVA